MGTNNGNAAESAACDAMSASRGYVYGYDAVGNMASNNGVVQRYDAANQIKAAGAITYTYDNNGNQTGTSQTTLPNWLYDAQNHTIGYNDVLSSETFTVDGSTQRRAKTIATVGTTTSGVFNGDMYRQTTPISRTIYYVADPSGRLLAVTDGTTVYYFGLDGHGSVANLTDKTGAVVNAYRYDPYGNSLSMTETASIPNPWRYGGGYLDAESGLYLLGARYYAPTLGRFLQQDPLGGDSQYAYAGSDPCNNSDPSGLSTCYEHLSPGAITDLIDGINDSVQSHDDKASSATVVGAVGGGAAGGAVAGAIACSPGGPVSILCAAAAGIVGSIVAGVAGALAGSYDSSVASNERGAVTWLLNHGKGPGGAWIGFNLHNDNDCGAFSASASHGNPLLPDSYWGDLQADGFTPY